ncbi:O-methyltransferase [Phosphitispora fastidiosa]|uniref:O-methyltransferase n=1 Tax=Phosphitispora fastidiosa TaxID=2837202 RepID=UPI001E3FAD52|nr:O-methyltransferase [Phosphitispora fastidiosa]MBU7007928.1 putative O-methyltransferase YrrM [Phosphitispora fastidiosa]
MVSIINPQIEEYIRGLAPERPDYMLEMERYAEENYVSIIPPEVAQFLTTLIHLSQAREVLEIGTAIAYSTIWLAWAAAPRGGHITTIEINERRAAAAVENIRQAGLEDKITLLKGHAVDIVPHLKDEYDFIFIDAAKGQYGWFFEELYPRLKPGGLLVSDNVLAEGAVVVPEEELRHRQKTAVRRLRDYLRMITSHPGLETTIIPFGDGLAVSLKK